MLWSIMDNIHGSIDICQNKVSAGWPPDRIAGSGVDQSRSNTFLKLPADKLLVSNDRRLKFIFLKSHMKYVVFMSLWPRTIKILISN